MVTPWYEDRQGASAVSPGEKAAREKATRDFLRRAIPPKETDQELPSPAQMRLQAAEKVARARRLEAEAEALEREADEVERARAKKRGLTAGLESGTVNRMTPSQRKTRSRAAVSSTDEFMAAVHLSFASMTDLAKKLGISVQMLSGVRGGKKKMPLELALRIERLIGYPADKWTR